MGVEFRAVDGESGRMVALRRFFPFGMEGGGLQPEERAAYGVALQRLMEVRHPALRSVVGGGCDPVDGMPFLVTEWVGGERLDEILAGRLLAGSEAVELLSRVLEVSAALSGALGEEACWVETDPASVRVDSDGARRFTFSISPMKWLGADGMGKRLEPLVPLVEAAMGWQGQVVGDAAGGGLGGWVKWLRGNAGEASIFEARERLAVATGGQAATPTQRMMPTVVAGPRVVARPFSAPVVQQQGGGGRMWMILGGVAAVLVLGGVFLVLSGGKDRSPETLMVEESAEAGENLAAAAPAASRAAEDVTARATRMAAELAEQRTEAREALAARVAAVEQRGGHYLPEESDLLVLRKGEDVVVEGTFVQIRRTSSGATFYFEFSKDPGNEEVRGYLLARSARPGVTPQGFQPLVGKKVRMSGTVRVISYGGVPRPEVLIEDMGSIVEVP